MKNDVSRRGFIKASVMASLGIGMFGPNTKSFENHSPALKGKRVGIIGLDTSHAIHDLRDIKWWPP